MSQKNQKKKIITSRPPEMIAQAPTIFERLEIHLARQKKAYIVFILCAATLCAVLLFDVKISTANDDSMYIEAAWNYAKNFFGYFYTTNAPLYPMLLSLPVKLFGINVVLLKALSIPFFVAGIWLLYRAFAGRVPYLILFFALFVTATNSLFNQYASLTYTECFFSFVQGLFFLVFLKMDDKIHANGASNWRRHLTDWLLIGATMWLLYISRSVAIGTVAVVGVYYLLQKKWLSAVYSSIAFGIFVGFYGLLKKILWGGVASQFGNQANVMFQKDAYDVAKGQETAWGFVVRFYTNAEIYLSSRLFQMLGFREEANLENSIPLTILVVLLFLFGLFFAFRKANHAVLLAALYAGGLCAITFLILHTSWGQGRLVMIFLPFILLTIFYGFYQVLQRKSLAGLQLIFVVGLVIFAGGNFRKTWQAALKNAPILGENMGGDKYYGYTPDWINYLKMSEWCSKNLPDTALVACRKAPMSFIYGNGKQFYSIFNVVTNDADSLVNILKKRKVSHILIAELRTNPNVYIENTYINTIHRFLSPILAKYPNSFNIVHTEGVAEKAQLLKINYDQMITTSAPLPVATNTEKSKK